jgi:hypothetical protein
MAIEKSTISYFNIMFENIMKTGSFTLTNDLIKFDTIQYNPTVMFGTFPSEVYKKYTAYIVPYEIIVIISDDDVDFATIRAMPYVGVETQTFAALDAI